MKKLFSLVLALATATTMAFAASTASGEFDCGQMVRLNVTPNEGYEFVEWQNSAGITVSTSNPYDVPASATTTYTAILKLKEYPIRYFKGTKTDPVSGEPAKGSPSVDYQTHGKAKPLRTALEGGFSLTGHHQDGWSINADGSSNDFELGASYLANDSVRLYPHWAINHYTIQYLPGADATGTVEPTDKEYGTPVNLSSKTFTRVGYDQDGWSTVEGGGQAYVFGQEYSSNADATLYPFWKIHTYTITYNPGANGSGTVEATEQTYGIEAALSSNVFTRDDGYHQVGWAESDGGEKKFDMGAKHTSNKDMTLYPVWVKNTYRIRFIDWDGTVLDDQLTVEHDKTPVYGGIALDAPDHKPADAEFTYSFAGWEPTIVAATADADYIAQYDATKRTYMITFVNWNDSVLQASEVEYGTKPSAPVATRTETGHTWTFDGWTTNGIDRIASDALPNVTGEATYKAAYVDNIHTHDLTVVAGEGGTVSGGGTYAYGTTHEITATANECYRFVQWNDGDTTNPRNVTIPDEDVTYTATFEILKYTITATVDGGSERGNVTVTPVSPAP